MQPLTIIKLRMMLIEATSSGDNEVDANNSDSMKTMTKMERSGGLLCSCLNGVFVLKENRDYLSHLNTLVRSVRCVRLFSMGLHE